MDLREGPKGKNRWMREDGHHAGKDDLYQWKRVGEVGQTVGMENDLRNWVSGPSSLSPPSNRPLIHRIQRSSLPETFPDVMIQGPPGAASRHPDYVAAKHQGDVSAALRLVTDLLNDAEVERLREVIAGRPVILIPVYAEEAVSINRLPLAYAEVLADRLGVAVDTTIVQAAKVGRTQADGFQRLALQPPFDGAAPAGFPFAIVLDDTLTQGGTLANLSGHLNAQGVQVIAATTLTGKRYSAKLRLQPATLSEVRTHYADLESWWINLFGYGFDRLTESEARYLIKSGQTADAIRNRILTERQAAGFPAD